MKKIKIILIVIVVIVMFISMFIFLNSTSHPYEKYIGKIYKIEGNNIFIESTDITTFGFLINNAPLYDINQNKLDVSKLKVGDTIYVNENYQYEMFNNDNDYEYEEGVLHNRIPMNHAEGDLKLNKGVIEKIDEQFIVVNIQKEYYYRCTTENVIIMNRWYKITADKLNLGDTIEITRRKKDLSASSPIGDAPSLLSDVKLIKVLERNK